MSSPTAAASAHLPEITAELQRVLDSPEFRQSEQSKKLLRYLVEVSSDGAPEPLRERAIGAAVFGLEPGYDAAANPIVRVRANELRKRLAKYYQHPSETSNLRFEIPAGGYRVEFCNTVSPTPTSAPVLEPVSPPATRRNWLRIGLTGAGVTAAATSLYRLRPALPLERFWQPALRHPAPVLLCSGHPVVYRFTRQIQERIRGQQVNHFDSQTSPFQLGKDVVLHGGDIVAIPDQYIGWGSAEATSRIYGWLQRHQKDADIRFGSDLTFTDLRHSPAVLIGAFQNRWTVELMKSLRFRFDDGREPGVKDTKTGKRWSLPGLQENGRTTEDYVLISRLLNSPTGEFLIAGAGITQYGGHTVAEVLANEGAFKSMISGLSPNWAERNLQILMHVKVLGQTAGPPEIVDLHEW